MTGRERHLSRDSRTGGPGVSLEVVPAERCNECGAAEATTETITGRRVCQRCANRILGASAGTALGGVQSGVVTGLTTEYFTGWSERISMSRMTVIADAVAVGGGASSDPEAEATYRMLSGVDEAAPCRTICAVRPWRIAGERMCNRSRRRQLLPKHIGQCIAGSPLNS